MPARDILEIDFRGMKPDWFPIPLALRRVLEGIDPVELTSRASTSPSLYTLRQRGWISFEGYEPTAGRSGKQMYLRTTKGQWALEIDEKMRKRAKSKV